MASVSSPSHLWFCNFPLLTFSWEEKFSTSGPPSSPVTMAGRRYGLDYTEAPPGFEPFSIKHGGPVTGIGRLTVLFRKRSKIVCVMFLLLTFWPGLQIARLLDPQLCVAELALRCLTKNRQYGRFSQEGPWLFSSDLFRSHPVSGC